MSEQNKLQGAGEEAAKDLSETQTVSLINNIKFSSVLTADRLAQLVEYRGFKPRPDQHSGSLNNRGEIAAFVTGHLQMVRLSSLLG